MLKNDTFTILSNDCWGAEVYRHFGLAYRTPFVGLFMMAPCYITLLEDWQHWLGRELTFVPQTKYPECAASHAAKGYPIGLLGGRLEVHFLHYKTEAEARDTWTKRLARINPDNLFVKFDAAKDGATPEHMARFAALPFAHKVMFTDKPHPTQSVCLYIPGWEKDAAKLYRHSLRSLAITRWLNGTGLRTNAFDRVLWWLLIRKNRTLL